MQISNKSQDISFRPPKDGVSREEILSALAEIHQASMQGGLTYGEKNALRSAAMSLFTRAAADNLMTPEEITGNREFRDTAIGSMAFSGGGSGSVRMGNPSGPVLPRTGSSFVAASPAPTVRVGRWMHPKELDKMMKTGKVQENLESQTRAAYPAGPGAYRNAPKGDVYVEFDVPADRVLPHSQGTVRIPGPRSRDAFLAARRGEDTSRFEMPPATNIKVH